MRLIAIFIFFSFSSIIGFSQAKGTGISSGHIPVSKTSSTTLLAEYIKENYNLDRDKAWAIFDWVTTNISYDTDSINSINLGVNQEAKITEAFRRRKGVCENFAAIFNDICKKSGIVSFVIDGYTKQLGHVDKVGHNWCAVFIDGQWHLSDPTWASSSGSKAKYFLVNPSEFIESHMPFDPLWQCLNFPVTHQQFHNGNTYPKKGQSYFNYADSISAFLKLDSMQQFKASAARLQQSGLYNDLARNRNNYLKMHIEMINQDKDVDLYNTAIAELNDATAAYNNFVLYRNNLFTPLKSDPELLAMLNGLDKKLVSALKKVDEIERSPATFTFSAEALRNKLDLMLVRINAQLDFLARYLATNSTERNSLFYK